MHSTSTLITKSIFLWVFWKTPSLVLLAKISVSNQEQEKLMAGLSPDFVKQQFQQSIKPEKAFSQVLCEK